MKKIKISSIFLLLAIIFTAFSSKSTTEIEEIKIGSQTWALKNLNVAHFKNGDEIKQVTSDTEWLMASINKEPVWCYFQFDEANGKTYGKLYNGYAIVDKRGLAPNGWRIPSDNDWKTLETHIGKDANKLKTDSSNETGFSALYSGSINENGSFMSDFFMAWSNTKLNNKMFYRRLNNYNIAIDRKLSSLGSGYAVRFIK